MPLVLPLFLQQMMIMKYTFPFFATAWKGIISEIKHCAFKVYFIKTYCMNGHFNVCPDFVGSINLEH